MERPVPGHGGKLLTFNAFHGDDDGDSYFTEAPQLDDLGGHFVYYTNEGESYLVDEEDEDDLYHPGALWLHADDFDELELDEDKFVAELWDDDVIYLNEEIVVEKGDSPLTKKRRSPFWQTISRFVSSRRIVS